MSIKSKTQLHIDIDADGDFTTAQKTVLKDTVDSYGNAFAQVDTTQRDALTPTTGLMVFNTDTTRYEFWDGANWFAVGQNVSTPITVKVEISNTDLHDTGGVPFTLVSAPPVGYAILPLNVFGRLNYISEEFDFLAASTAIVAYGNKEVYSKRFFELPVTFLNATEVVNCSAENNTNESDKLVESDALVLMDTNGGPTQGDGTVTLWITYSIISI